MAGTVKMYRVLKDGMKVGTSVRRYGDFIPEAADWPNTDAYLRAKYIEVTYVSEEEVAAWEEELRERESLKPKKKRVIRRKQNDERSDAGEPGSTDDGTTGGELRGESESDEGRDDSGDSESAGLVEQPV